MALGTAHRLFPVACRLKKLHHEEGDVESGYILTFGSDSIGSYDGTLHPRPCYEQHWYVFGDGCQAGFAPTEGMIADSDCLEAIDASSPGKQMLCVRFEFNGMTDDRHTLVDSTGKIVWNETASSQKKYEDKFFKTKCLDATKCYRFTLFDAIAFPNSSSGAPTHRVTDSFSLSLDGSRFGSYNATADGCFTAKWYQFGLCPNGHTNGTIGQGDCPVHNDTKELLGAPPLSTACTPFAFSIFTDEYPMDVSYQLTNAAGNNIWTVDANTLMDQNSLYYRQSCLDSNDCYLFRLNDSEKYQDGYVGLDLGASILSPMFWQ
jgi:hypothetical protein